MTIASGQVVTLWGQLCVTPSAGRHVTNSSGRRVTALSGPGVTNAADLTVTAKGGPRVTKAPPRSLPWHGLHVGVYFSECADRGCPNWWAAWYKQGQSLPLVLCWSKAGPIDAVADCLDRLCGIEVPVTRGVREWLPQRRCACGCGRGVGFRARTATMACRQRLSRRERAADRDNCSSAQCDMPEALDKP